MSSVPLMSPSLDLFGHVACRVNTGSVGFTGLRRGIQPGPRRMSAETWISRDPLRAGTFPVVPYRPWFLLAAHAAIALGNSRRVRTSTRVSKITNSAGRRFAAKPRGDSLFTATHLGIPSARRTPSRAPSWRGIYQRLSVCYVHAGRLCGRGSSPFRHPRSSRRSRIGRSRPRSLPESREWRPRVTPEAPR